jgi:LPPG:FO 2-phospho-L-lactate transferase
MIKPGGSAGHVLALSGGVGGAKLALGLSRVLPAEQLTIACNTADDFEHYGLPICPDLDTVTYTLAGRNNPEQGWGLDGESWQVMSALGELDADTWFNLGDRDLATHLLRLQWRNEGLSLTQITKRLCDKMGVPQRILPMTDHPVATVIQTEGGDLPFQHYFVKAQCQPKVTGFYFDGMANADIQGDLATLIASPDVSAIVICPSNPFVSIDPILQLPGMTSALRNCQAPVIAVSPIVGGKALKGPAAKMMQELGIQVSTESVANHYNGLVDGFVLDLMDQHYQQDIEGMGMKTMATNTVMTTLQDRMQLAKDCLQFASLLQAEYG